LDIFVNYVRLLFIKNNYLRCLFSELFSDRNSSCSIVDRSVRSVTPNLILIKGIGMKTLCAWFFMLLLLLPVLGLAVNSLQINATTDLVLTELPETITLQCNEVKSGERLDIEYFIDVNNNNEIDFYDYKFDQVTLVDGIGWIRDAEASENDIPGDEAEAAGVISTTLPVSRQNHPCGSQTWLVRAAGQGTPAVAVIHWNLTNEQCSVYGNIRDNYSKTGAAGELLFATEIDYAGAVYSTMSDSCGNYHLSLEPGTWKIYTHTCSDTVEVTVAPGKKVQKDLRLNPLASFISGQAYYENGNPAPGLIITAQNPDLLQFYFATTDHNGRYVLNVAPGTIEISCNPALHNRFGNNAWPDGYYAVPQQETVVAEKAGETHVNIRLEHYPITLHGVCLVNGQGLAGVLVQGAARNNVTGKMQLFQTWTRGDGSFDLGVSGEPLVTLVAQKTGYTLHQENGYLNIDPSTVTTGFNFTFSAEKPLMTISGALNNDDMTPACNVPVIAYNPEEKSSAGYIMQRTDAQGQFSFYPEVEGAWQIGLYKKDFKSIPPLYYLYVNEGMGYTDIKFYLYQDKDYARIDEGHFKPMALNIIPNQPLPFEAVTSIQFVLPEARCTRVQMLDMDGNSLRTLVDEKLSGGKHTIAWDGADSNGNPLNSGIYWCRIDAVNETMQQAITLLR